MPPYIWADNPDTLLGQADLVFVNPVGTAFSRPDQPSTAPSFWNTRRATSLPSAEFVRSYHQHQQSPQFTADSSRAKIPAPAARRVWPPISSNMAFRFNGVALLSMTQSPDAIAGDAQYITLLPSLTMAAWTHKKLPPELNAMSAEQIAGEARQFASRDYLHALYKGDRMPAEERTKAIADLARLPGLSKAFLVNNGLRVTARPLQCASCMRDQHRGLSPSDARVTGFMRPAGGRRSRRRRRWWLRRRRPHLHRFQS